MSEVHELKARVEVLERQLGEPGYVDALRAACEGVARVLAPMRADLEEDQVEMLPEWVARTIANTRTVAFEEAAQRLEAARLQVHEEFRILFNPLPGLIRELAPLPSYLVLVSPAIATQLRAFLWLGHGHTGQYGDDGEMQCGECLQLGEWDYRRASFEALFATIERVNLKRLVEAIGGKSK